MATEFAPETTTHLKDVLRSLRYSLRKGRDTVKETAPRRLPAPASAVTLSTLREIEILAQTVDQFVCKVAHSVFSSTATNSKSLRQIVGSSRPEYEFSVSFYETMKRVLSYLGATRALVNQGAGWRAYSRFADSQDIHQLAAQLTLHLSLDGSITVDQLDDRASLTRSGTVVVGIFAGMLSLLAEADDADRDAIICAASDLAVALQDKILDLSQNKDISALAALFQRCAAHV
ncbi:hypothetical protein [Rhizobium sp. Rhizsp82]|uniref:hypothetical protein n=1 Tax=Rhizobium sp. Rhizsp82 TaxID=3243057 RepID=UPI0039B5723C